MKWIAALAFIGALAVSCTEMDESYDGSFWKGEYAVQRICYVMREPAPVGIVEVIFEPGSNQCTVAFGLKGSDVLTAEKFEARWSRRNRFALYSFAGGQSLLCYSGIISGDKMTLTAQNCDSVAESFELSRFL